MTRCSTSPVLQDVFIPKPAGLKGYPLHRLVAEYQRTQNAGAPALWRDEGRLLRVRSSHRKVRSILATGDIVAFTASVCFRFAGRKKEYAPLDDIDFRRGWMERRGLSGGFEVLGVHFIPQLQLVHANDRRSFMIDATDVTGLIKIVDPYGFARTYFGGLGADAKAFGMGMIVLN